MSWLLFLDESGHDHRTMPYEVRGGVAICDSQLWSFVQDIERLELASFGTALHQFRTELKGSKLLDKDRFKWSAQAPPMNDEERRKHCRGFLTKGLEKKSPSRDEFTAYGQASLEMATGIFASLRDHGAILFAVAIPCNVEKSDTYEAENYLRKDHVFLIERFFYLLEREEQYGLIVMDEVEKAEDRRFVRRLEAYFRKTEKGQYRSGWIVPTPFFVSSDMTFPVQAADLAIYCVNWGFRLPGRGMDAPVREEIANRFGTWLAQLQYHQERNRDGAPFDSYGIVYVPDPYQER
jgi:glutathione S-transferase